MSILDPGQTRLRGIVGRLRTMMAALALALMPLAAWAQDADEQPTPIDPKTAAAQNRIIGTILVIILAAVAWYWLRRWQITRNSNRPPDNKDTKE